MRRFYAAHPEWADSAPLGPEFHYKWYLAFHQNGDESVAEQVRAYRTGLEARDAAGREGAAELVRALEGRPSSCVNPPSPADAKQRS